MSKSYWLYCAAIGGLLVALLVGGECCAQGNATDKPAQTQQQQSTSPPAPVTLQPITNPVDYAFSCAHPKDHEAADLCQQIRQAQAGEDNVSWVKFQTYLGIFGAVLVICSLVFSGWAAREASRAARASVAAAETAEKSIFEVEAPFLYPESIAHRLRRELGEIQLKDHPSSPRGTVTPTIHFKIKNFGKGPAILRRFGFWAQVLDDLPDSLGVDLGVAIPMLVVESGGAIPDAGPTASFRATVFPAIDTDLASQITAGTRNIVLFGEVHFIGVQGGRYIQQFGLTYDRHSGNFRPLGVQYNRRIREPDDAEPSQPWWRRWRLRR